jgi:hypothetical protein
MKRFNVSIEAPRNPEWPELFRFIVQTMDADDPNMDFVVNVWSYYNAHGEMTISQHQRISGFVAKYIKSYMGPYYDDYIMGTGLNFI